MDKPQDSKGVGWFWIVAWMMLLGYGLLGGFGRGNSIPYSQFLSDLNQGQVSEVRIDKDLIEGKLKPNRQKVEERFTTSRVDPQLASQLAGYKVKFEGGAPDNPLLVALSWVVPPLLLLGVWMFLLRRFADRGGMGPEMMTIGKSKARVYMEQEIKVSFADVAGVDEAKDELKEVVSFLKEPEHYNRLGGRLPKGILLVGPPGTGKTLLARAVAGEARVPFFSISGSEFVEMFVGVGAARVRDLFQQAQTKAPCIIFIDELDALGKARGLHPMGGGFDEKEQTLNQLLVELDGFDPRQGVVLLAATNRPEILDPALLRAGRFDRHVLVDRPDKKGRVQILAVHLHGVTVNPDLILDEIAAMTPGFTGADLANLVNEAALLAARREADSVAMADFSQAIERIVAGLEKKNRLLNPVERRVVAHHEMGHALVALSIPGSDPVQKVSIIPRGIGALGYTMQRPIEDRFLMSRAELLNKTTVLLGGRAAEWIVFREVSTGAADDLAKATEIARSMVTRYGMDGKVGPVALEAEMTTLLQGATPGTSQHYSEETAREIDCAVRRIVCDCFEKAVSILKPNRALLESYANQLLSKETLTQNELPDVAEIISPKLAEPSEGEPDGLRLIELPADVRLRGTIEHTQLGGAVPVIEN